MLLGTRLLGGVFLRTARGGGASQRDEGVGGCGRVWCKASLEREGDVD